MTHSYTERAYGQHTFISNVLLKMQQWGLVATTRRSLSARATGEKETSNKVPSFPLSEDGGQTGVDSERRVDLAREEVGAWWGLARDTKERWEGINTSLVGKSLCRLIKETCACPHCGRTSSAMGKCTV